MDKEVTDEQNNEDDEGEREMSDSQIAVTLDESESATPESHLQLAGASIEGGAEVRGLIQSLAQTRMLRVVD